MKEYTFICNYKAIKSQFFPKTFKFPLIAHS
jgi:hypothetical protein